MESLTKNKKGNSEIAVLIKEALGSQTNIADISELTKGSFNAVYKITLADKSQCALKIAPNASAPILRNEKNIMKAEVRALHIIKAHTAMPAPEILYASETSSLCDSPFAIMQWMKGEEYQTAAPGYSDEAKNAVLSELGKMTHAFHQIYGTAFGPLGNESAQFSTWYDAFSALFQNILEDGIAANVKLPFDYDYLFKLEEKGKPFLKDVTTPCLIHGDLWPGNILVSNGKISALLDFERSLWGDPLMEYPFGLIRNNKAFLKGYGPFSFDASGVSAQVRRTLYNLYHYLIVIIEKPYRGFKSGNADYFVTQKIIAEANSLKNLI